MYSLSIFTLCRLKVVLHHQRVTSMEFWTNENTFTVLTGGATLWKKNDGAKTPIGR